MLHRNNSHDVHANPTPQDRTGVQRASEDKCVAARSPLRTLTAAQRSCNAVWLRAQLAELAVWLTESPQLWPHVRVIAALQAIHAGDERWRLKAAEVLR